ncbi:MAG: carbonic anhydrase family protein [Thiobacillus sp.]|nr:carbonic anhydrase family protein [Thiobacillus sp.]
MKVRTLAFVLLAITPPAFSADAHWSYQGEHGPSHWSKLDSHFTECGIGHAQSPVDIRKTVKKSDLPDLTFQYNDVPLRLVNNGHTVQVNEDGGGSLTIGDHAYKLAQFHFHTPSEERVNGKPYDLVAHLVHKDEAGKLAVVAVLFKVGHQNAALAAVLDNMPIAAGPEHTVAGMRFNVAQLLPAQHGYYHFMGSLTTPPCSEGVSWYVLKTPVELSSAQLKQLRRLYNHNNRPVQPLNGREVVEHI